MLFFPDLCGVCSTEGPSPCSACAATLPGPPVLAAPNGVDRFFALFAYRSNARRLIAGLKFRNRRGALDWLAARIAAGVNAEFDCVTWMPSSHEGRRERGFDPAKLLARRVARQLKLPAYELMTRDGGERQTHHSAAQRHGGPHLRVRPRAFRMARVLLIDDVCTTGASIEVAAALLRTCGVTHITAAVAARTPLSASPSHFQSELGA